MSKKYPIDYVPKNSRLTFIKRISEYDKKTKSAATGEYRCQCGKLKVLKISNVKNGNSKSCGCISNGLPKGYVKTHGLTNTPIYKLWRGMIIRCYYKKACNYGNYGGRGVRVCKEWKNSVKAFYDWAISNGWQKGLQLDKDIKAKALGLPNNLYSPERCQFVSGEINSQTRINTKYITYNGETKSISEWASYFNIGKKLLSSRIYGGVDIEKALTKPIATQYRKKTKSNAKDGNISNNNGGR